MEESSFNSSDFRQAVLICVRFLWFWYQHSASGGPLGDAGSLGIARIHSDLVSHALVFGHAHDVELT
jgi:hypothetical protein